ncbi:TetR/AcrR family transcriptional regulator [Pseudonocardia sp. CA-107938]|uniref:TetR/AcrR family transcriptional regulator n=1 Tax=Pseudonocardia sp. CA-107938 TaxID=3240021 RepID=UPI003D9286B3
MAHVPVEERRTQLVQAAVRVISRDGVAAASTRRIAEEAGASQASLHYSFRSKEELFAAVTEYAVDATRVALEARQVVPGSGLRHAVAQLLALFRESALTERDLTVAQYELQMWALHAPAHQDLAAHCYARFTEVLSAVLDAAATPAEQGIDTARLARLLMVVADGTALQLLACGPAVAPDPDLLVVADGLLSAAEQTATRSGSID